MSKELIFNTTVAIVEFDDYNILIESYWECSDGSEDKEIFDVAKEYKITNNYSETVVLFESYNVDDCYDYIRKELGVNINETDK